MSDDANRVDQDTEQRILDAAHAVFLRRGTTGARMQEIAEEAGVNKALLHYYFRSKERLAEAVFVRAARGLLPPVIETLGSDATLEEKVERVVAIEIDHLSRNRFLPGYILSELTHHPERAAQLFATGVGVPVDGVAPRVLAKLGAQIDDGVRAGTLRPIAPEQFVVNLLAVCIFPFAASPMLKAVFGWDDDGFDRFLQERRRVLPRLFLDGVRP
jgi:AcrR family transcriptional regulator